MSQQREPPQASRTVPQRDLPPSAHVLIVEDDVDTRLLLTRFLVENGMRATGARDGREMWDVLGRVPVDLVLLDIMLPGANGLDLCRALRDRSDVAVIMVTARGAETDRVLGLEFGADDYVAVRADASADASWRADVAEHADDDAAMRRHGPPDGQHVPVGCAPIHRPPRPHPLIPQPRAPGKPSCPTAALRRHSRI